MVNPVGPNGFQPYAAQPSVIPPDQSRGGSNRVEQRQAPAPDTQRQDERRAASRNDEAAAVRRREEQQEDDDKKAQARGQNLDVLA
jgi:hypothetical protein